MLAKILFCSKDMDLFQVDSSLRREILCGGMREGREIRMAPALAVVATTSTPINFVTQFAIAPEFQTYEWNLEGIIPDFESCDRGF